MVSSSRKSGCGDKTGQERGAMVWQCSQIPTLPGANVDKHRVVSCMFHTVGIVIVVGCLLLQLAATRFCSMDFRRSSRLFMICPLQDNIMEGSLRSWRASFGSL